MKLYEIASALLVGYLALAYMAGNADMVAHTVNYFKALF